MNRSKKETSASHMKKLASLNVVLAPFFKRWSILFPSHPVSKQLLKIYLENLTDLTIEQLRRACVQAELHAQFFPLPAHIRSYVPQQSSFCGPPLHDYSNEPPLTDSELAAATEYSNKFREHLASIRHKPRFTFSKPTPPIDEQLDAMKKRGLLK